MRLGGLTDPANLTWAGGLLVGQSSTAVCDACSALGQSGCAPKMSKQSYNQGMPFSPAIGLQSAMFGVGFTPGPEKKVRPCRVAIGMALEKVT